MTATEADADFWAEFMKKEHEKARQAHGRRVTREARSALERISGVLGKIEPIPGGKAASVDAPFAETNTFLPSTFIATQLGLAIQYIQTADAVPAPNLTAFVVLRAAIECTSTAHWLMSANSHRESVERILKRMWWDTQSAAEMALAVDEETDLVGLEDLRSKIELIARPIKRLDATAVTTSARTRLSGIVEDASRMLHPEAPATTYAAWMLCAAISHGNIPASAGTGLSPALIQRPSMHLIDEPVYAQLLSVAVADLSATVEIFARRASEPHSHRASADA